MTKQEKIIVSAYTGYLMCEFEDLHKYIEEALGRPVFTHELADKDVLADIREAIKPEFMALCSAIGEVPAAEVVDKKDYEELLRAAKKMHAWIFLNSFDEAEAFRECGLSEEMNTKLGYLGSVVLSDNKEVEDA